MKEELLKKCNEFVKNRLENIQQTISSNQKALNSETKSSAGDKHETGRAMLQLEMEKAGKQLSNISDLKNTLAKIDVSKKSKIAHLGSVIKTTEVNYFLSISVGQIIVRKEIFYAISISSPIGKILLGKQENDVFNFNSKLIKIIEVN